MTLGIELLAFILLICVRLLELQLNFPCLCLGYYKLLTREFGEKIRENGGRS